ncbi:MAG: carboxypeptidase-like regulatory domain-containing protein [Bacteroidota bacterium]
MKIPYIHIVSIILVLFVVNGALGQEVLQGKVVTPKGVGILAANVQTTGTVRVGTITDQEGRFQLDITNVGDDDSLKVQFPGFQVEMRAIGDVRNESGLVIQMKNRNLSLEEVMIEARRPISDQFSVERMSKMDVYLNPVAAGDPLRAVTILPSSTNTDESANPSLRGSSAARSRVILNGVPVYQPVRNSQINGIGNFSLFNTELLDEQLVYASNPPLTFGNVSGGIVQLNTVREVNESSTQLSVGMANLGAFRTQKLKNGAFFQAYTNYQVSDLFLKIHPEALGFLQDFGSLDAGLHWYLPLSNSWSFQGISYGIQETYAANAQVYAYNGLAQANKGRTFHVGNLQYQSSQFVLFLRGGFDASQTDYQYGNIRSHTQTRQSYASVEAKGFVGSKMVWQVGANYDGYYRSFDDTASIYFYALSPSDPAFAIDTQVRRPLVEAHAYLKYDPSENTHLSLGVRSNLPLLDQSPFLSFQGAVRHDLSSRHSLLMSLGRYHSYTIPGFFFRGTELLRADQAALDYSYTSPRLEVKAALYAKDEIGSQLNGEIPIRRAYILGAEFFARVALHRYLSITVANSWIHHRVRFSEGGDPFNGNKDFPYFTKASIAYNNPRLFSATLTWIGRPGAYFNPIVGGTFNEDLNLYAPTFDSSINSRRLGDYQNLSLGISRYFRWKDRSLVLFFNVNNLLDRSNPSTAVYDPTFTVESFQEFSRRTIYAGLVWQLIGKR